MKEREKEDNIEKIKNFSKAILRLCIILMAVMTMAVFTSCSVFESEEVKTFKSSAVTVTKYYDYLEWDLLENATSYEIYNQNTLVETTSSNVYTFGSTISSDMNLYVVAKSSTLDCSSTKSNTVTVYKNTNFSSAETLDISESNGSNAISSNIRRVIIKDFDGTKTITVGDRTADLYIELSNVTLDSGLDLSASSESSNIFNVTIMIDGDVAVTGAAGTTQTTKFADESGKDGIDGGDGENAITVSGQLVITGDGNLTLTGGDGGDGGDGADVNSFLSTAAPGAGSDGGDGGAGIECDTLIVQMSSDSIVNVSGGSGGEKGEPGNNGSIITGPTCSAIWSISFDIGVNGNDGASIIGTVKCLSGTLLY